VITVVVTYCNTMRYNATQNTMRTQHKHKMRTF